MTLFTRVDTRASDGNALFIARTSTLSVPRHWTSSTSYCDMTTKTGSPQEKQWSTRIFVSFYMCIRLSTMVRTKVVVGCVILRYMYFSSRYKYQPIKVEQIAEIVVFFPFVHEEFSNKFQVRSIQCFWICSSITYWSFDIYCIYNLHKKPVVWNPPSFYTLFLLFVYKKFCAYKTLKLSFSLMRPVFSHCVVNVLLDPVLKGYVSPAKTPNAAPVTGMHTANHCAQRHALPTVTKNEPNLEHSCFEMWGHNFFFSWWLWRVCHISISVVERYTLEYFLPLKLILRDLFSCSDTVI